MKTKIKRHSRSALSVLLTICMLISCMTVGIIATDAAKTADERVGANEVNKDFIYVDISACSDKEIDGLNCWWDTGCTNWGEWITTKTDMGNYVYKFVFTHSSHTYFRGFKVEFTDGVKVSVAVPADNTNDMIIIDDDRTSGTWSTYTPLANPTTMTATVSHSKSGGARIVSGDGKVSVDGGTASSTTATKTVEMGSSVTFTATPDSGYSFAGWYSDEACTTRLSTSTSYTVTASSDTTVYAAFNKEHYYLVGKFYQANLARERIENNNSTSFAFTQSPSDPALYTYTDDFMFKYDSANGQYHLQYISIGYGGTHAYNTSSAGAASGTAASGTTTTNAHNDEVNKWTCGDLSTPSYPPSDLNNCYKTVTFTWNAITETLSWTVTDINMSNYTALYIDCESFIWDHLWLTNGSVLTGQSGAPGGSSDIAVPGTPHVIDGNTVYNLVLVSTATSGGKTIEAQLNDGTSNPGPNRTGNIGPFTEGGSYSITGLTTGGTGTVTSDFSPAGPTVDRYYLAGQYSDGSTQFFGGQWNTTNNELTRNGANYTKTFTTNIPAGTIQFKVVKNGDWDEGSWPEENQSYVIRDNATSVTFTFDPSTHTTTVTQTNSGGSGDGTWPPTDTEVTNITSSETNTSKYLLVSNNDNFDNNGGNVMTAVALEKKYSSGNNTYYWADLTDYMSYGTIHAMLSRGSSKNDASSFGTASKVNSGGFPETSVDEKTFTSGSTNLFSAKGAERDSVYHRVEIYNKHSSLTHIGVVIRTNHGENGGEANNWVEYGFYYTDYTAPVVETQVVDIYAKDATLRDDTFNRFARLATTTIDSSDEDCFEYTDEDGVTYTTIAAYNTAKDPDIAITRVSYGGTDAGYTLMTNVPVGAKVKIKTTLSDNASATGSFNSTAFKNTHYVKGYSFNGVTYQINEWESDGVYEEIWTVRAVNTTYKDSNDVLQNATTGGKVVEVTPIYYMKDNSNCKIFYIDGYDGEVQNAWGNMLAVYPYYEYKSNSANAFGGYPGQPMLLWGGKYQMEIPLTVDGTANGASVKGLTLHNGYWDLLHRSIDIRCNARNHAQTYDYDDFYKLYKEKNPDTIIFDFKYRTAEDNYNDGYDYTRYTFADGTTKNADDYTGDEHNGVEIVTDYFGRQVDAFGTLIADGSKSHYGEDDGNGGTVGQTNEILFVSTGYKDTYVGEYATIWAVYQSNGTFIGYISSSMLYLNNIDRRLQYTGGDSTDSGRMSWANFISTYNTLKTSYTGVPALIVYDKEIWNDSKDKANRSDGKWYYSNKSDKISASIKIQYGAYSLYEAPDHSVSSDAWIDDPFNESKTGVGGYNNIGTNTGCSAYFTNTTPNLNGKVASGEQFADSTKKFTFQAVPSGSYMFAGWVRYSNGKYYEITEQELGESPMSSNDVYIARFVTAKTGTLTVQHVVEQTNDYNGTGTPSLTVTVRDGNGNNVSGRPFTVSDGSKIDISKWIDIRNATYTIDISLTTTPSNESFMKNIASSSGNYAATPNTWNGSYTKESSSGADTAAKTSTVAQFTVQQILDSGITSLRYVSHLMKPVYTYQYEITYTYTSRFWGAQSYTQTGTCEEGDFTGSKDTATLTTDFIIGKTPYEKNFRQQINWNYTASAVGDASAMTNTAATDQGSNTYKMTAHVYSSNTVNDRVTAEFILPYYYNEKSQDYSAHVADVYNSASDAHDSYQSQSYLYDTSHESVTLDTQAYKLFTTDDQDHGGSDDTLASSLHLIEAAPYLMMDGTTEQTKLQYHYMLEDNMRYYTGNSFKIGDTTYYKSQDDVPQGATNYQVLTGSNSVTFTKIKYAGTNHTTTYHYAVEDTSGGQKGQYGYKIYFFSYVTNDEGDYLDNNGNTVNSPTFNGQYCVYSVGRDKDGIIAGTGVKKYFTRWDIYNTKGEFVASCYNRRFNYSGYDNYVVRPIYESDTEQNYASSSGLDNGTLANITYLGDTRNQWNNGAKGDYATVTGKTDGNTAGDKLIHDFALAYAYNGQEIQKVATHANGGADIKVGMIIEQLDVLDSAGGAKIVDSSYYAEKYNKSSNAHRPEVDMPKIKTWLEGNAGENVKLSTYLGHTCINSKIGNNVDNSWGQKFGSTPAENSPTNKMSFDSVIDNFNRLQWFYMFTNTKTGEGGTIGAANNANFAYRAWAYIIVDGVATVSSTPTYFTLYDSASR